MKRVLIVFPCPPFTGARRRGQGGRIKGMKIPTYFAPKVWPKMSDTTHLEEKIAQLEKAVDDISSIVAEQHKELSLMVNRVRMLTEREAQREADGSGGVVIGDERPPHY